MKTTIACGLILMGMAAAAPATAAMTAAEEIAKKANSTAQPTVAVPMDTKSYTSSTARGVLWTRPFEDGTCCTALGPMLLDSQTFTVSANSSCDISSVQPGWDGYIFLYRDAFDPSNPTANFVAANDDGFGGIGTSNIFGVPLTSGTTYHLVTTGFSSEDVGEYTNTISCGSAQITIGAPVPTLSEWAMLLLALGLAVGAGLHQRRA